VSEERALDPVAAAESAGTESAAAAAAPAAGAGAGTAQFPVVAEPPLNGSPPVRLEPGPEGIVYLTFDHPERRVNIFTFEVLALLDRLLDELGHASEASAVIARSFKPDCFLAGADVEAIAGVRTRAEAMEASRLGQRIFAKVETLRLPVIAAIDGVCLGGGAEFAVACHYRVVSDRSATRIGFPEVRLGILPAWGGTQRLPHLVGVRRALDLILTGKTIDARRARAIGLADECLPGNLFADETLAFARRMVAEGRGPRRGRPRLRWGDRLLEQTAPGRNFLFARAEEQIYANTKGHYPAPPKALAAVRIGVERGNRAGYAVETRYAGELIPSPASRNLISLFFLTESVKKSRGIADPNVEPLVVRSLGLLGAGIMGGGIAYVATQAEIPVRLKDVNHRANLSALAHVRALSERGVERRAERQPSRRRPGHRSASQREVERRLHLISPTLDYSGFRRADLVIEAVVEDLEVKRAVFGELEHEVREDCILASNTSSLSITSMAATLRRPERFCGFHFFNPVHRMRLVEIVRGERTDDRTVATAFEFAKRLGKTPIVVGDRPGFLVNRILMPYLNEAGMLVEEGLPIEVIDRALVNFGMPMGPLELLDEVGLDVAMRAAKRLAEAYPDRVGPPKLLEAMVGAGRLGKKNGLGFYQHNAQPGSARGRQVDPGVIGFVDRLAPPGETGAGGSSGRGDSANAASAPVIVANVQERLILPMINEAARCLMEGVVRKPAEVDLGMVLGVGFPPFRGGLLRYADALELPLVVERLRVLVGEGRARYAPAPLLEEMARQGRRFYPDR
jgi:3-hydroxyacyl-CoA dehydrogenase/enoyl-CoA hydratase/3-hydroxybutyryl-CoA epimerase